MSDKIASHQRDRHAHRRRADPRRRSRAGPTWARGSMAERLARLPRAARRVPLGRRQRAARLGRDGRRAAAASRSIRRAPPGVIFFNNVGYLGMCGHGTIGVAVALAHLGADRPGTHRLETPVGVVDGRRSKAPTRVTIDNVAELSPGQGRARSTCPGCGRYVGDVAWGGNWFFLVARPRRGAEPGERRAADRRHLADPPGARPRRESPGPTAARSTTSSSSARRPCPAPTARTSCSARARPTTARPAAPAPAPSSPAWSPTASSPRARSGGRRASSAASSKARCSVEDGRVRPRIRGIGVRQRRGHPDRRPGRSVRDGYPAMSTSIDASRGRDRRRRDRHGLRLFPDRESGWQVTLVERGRFGRGSSHGNCGLVCPSHVLPLAEPGMVGKALKSSVQQQLAVRDQAAARPGPLVVAAALRRALQRARHDRGRPRHPAALELVAGALSRADRARRRSTASGRRAGCSFAYRSKDADGGLRRDRPADGRVVRTARPGGYDGDALVELEPALKPGLAGGWYYHDDAHLRPDKLMRPWRRVLEAGGVTIRENCAFQGFRRRDGRAVGRRRPSRRARRPMPSSSPPGPGRRCLNDQLGCRVPIQPGKGYSLTMPRPARLPEDPADLPRDPRRRHAVPVGLSARLDDGVRRLRRVDQPRAAPAPQGRCRSPISTSRTASRSRRNGSAGGR